MRSRCLLFLLILCCAPLALGQSRAAPKAGGAARVLLVIDDWNRSNGAPVIKKLVADAVGGDAKAWSSVVVKPNEHGPSADKLRDFNVVVWYTGDSYGGGYNHISTLSDEDEKTVRRYLQETGGAFILMSPGFLSTRSYGATWQKSDNPFLKEVVGIAGFADLVQRFTAGTVRTPGGETFAVQAKGTVETQFTAVNPDGASVVFSATLDPAKTAQGPVPVAVAHPYGGGRFVYVGFSLENMAEAERAKAFGAVLTAAGGPRTAAAGAPVLATLPAQKPAAPNQAIKPAPPGPAPINLQMGAGTPGSHGVSWAYADWTNNLKDRPRSYEVWRRDAGGWTLLGTRQLEGGKGQKVDSWVDETFRPTATAYRVVTVYDDGRKGQAEIEYPNPPQPLPTTGFVASQVRWDGVRLEWDRMAYGATGYRLYGPGLPADGARIPQSDYSARLYRPQLWDSGDPMSGMGTGPNYRIYAEVYKLGTGEHEFRVAHEYGPAGVSPIRVPVKVRVTASPPPVPTDLRVEQNGWRRITVRFKHAPNTYNGGVGVAVAEVDKAWGVPTRPGIDQWIEFREVPEGTYTFRVGYSFPYEPAPVLTETTFTVVNMPQTSNDISSCPGTWVTGPCTRPYDGKGGKGKAGDRGGKLGKK